MSAAVKTGRIKVDENIEKEKKKTEFPKTNTQHRLFPVVSGRGGRKCVLVYAVPFLY